jgi:hypothetical protein
MRFVFWQNGLRYLWTDTSGIVLIAPNRAEARPIFETFRKKVLTLTSRPSGGVAALGACAPALKLMGMLTLEDCVAFCGLTEEEVLAVAEHEHMPEIAATAFAVPNEPRARHGANP